VTLYHLRAGDHVLEASSPAEVDYESARLRASGGQLLTDDEFATVLSQPRS
jgi:hypothetical protein